MSDQERKLIGNCWKTSTKNSYDTQLRKWLIYCKETGIAPKSALFSEARKFLIHLHSEGAKYDTICAARSMLSNVLPKENGGTFGKDETVSKVLKALFLKNPRLPRHVAVYDPDIVLRYMASLPLNGLLTLEVLTYKLCTLLCLLSGQRSQTIGEIGSF